MPRVARIAMVRDATRRHMWWFGDSVAHYLARSLAVKPCIVVEKIGHMISFLCFLPSSRHKACINMASLLHLIDSPSSAVSSLLLNMVEETNRCHYSQLLIK
jgi:hypothetical protein